MSSTEKDDVLPESSLDLSEIELEQLSSQITHLVRDYFTHVTDLKIFPPTQAGKTTDWLGTQLNQNATSLEEIVSDFRTILGNSRHNGHPRFFGYVASPSSPVGAYADLLTSALNANVTSWRSGPAATEIEKIVIGWLGTLIGYDKNARGLLTSGGSMANLIAIHVAARRKTGDEISHRGLWNSGPPLTAYASREVHMSIPKAFDILGFGRDNLRLISTDALMRLKIDELEQAIESDLKSGFRPFCVVGSAGTVATGAVDSLAEIAAVAKKYQLWFHVDGAYGAPAFLDERKRSLFSGIEQADSVTLDPHKWLYVPIDVGSLLFRDDSAVRSAFAVTGADYIQTHGFSDDSAFAFWDYGVELSRRFRALKVWLTLRYYGLRRIAEAISKDISLAHYLGELVENSDDFELSAPVELSICCFRYVPRSLRTAVTIATGSERPTLEAKLDQLNEKIMTSLQKSGRAYVSNATVGGRFALRACITNFRTTRSDVDKTIAIVREIGQSLQ